MIELERLKAIGQAYCEGLMGKEFTEENRGRFCTMYSSEYGGDIPFMFQLLVEGDKPGEVLKDEDEGIEIETGQIEYFATVMIDSESGKVFPIWEQCYLPPKL